MTNVVDLAKALAGRENLRGKCQRLVGLIGDAVMGSGWSVPSYPNATAAYNAAKSSLISVDLSALEVGWIAYFEYRDAANNGHVGIIVGPDLMLSMTSNPAGLVSDLGGGLFLSTVSGYSKSRKLLGISKHNGSRRQIVGLSSPYDVKPKPDQRKVGPKTARRRADSNNAGSEYLSVANYPAGSIQTPTGWIHGAPVAGSTVWFRFADGRSVHSSAFTDAGVHDLKDLNPKPKPTEPTPTPIPEPEPTPEPEPVADVDLDALVAAAIERLPEIEGHIEQALSGSADANPTAPLSGLFAGNDAGRKRAYLIYAGAALLVSFGPDIVTANVLAGEDVPTFTAYLTLASSILLKIGTALGFVAASNTSKS
jgi:hypothetical protein